MGSEQRMAWPGAARLPQKAGEAVGEQDEAELDDDIGEHDGPDRRLHPAQDHQQKAKGDSGEAGGQKPQFVQVTPRQPDENPGQRLKSRKREADRSEERSVGKESVRTGKY